MRAEKKIRQREKLSKAYSLILEDLGLRSLNLILHTEAYTLQS